MIPVVELWIDDNKKRMSDLQTQMSNLQKEINQLENMHNNPDFALEIRGRLYRAYGNDLPRRMGQLKGLRLKKREEMEIKCNENLKVFDNEYNIDAKQLDGYNGYFSVC